MKELFNFIFTKPKKEEEPKWTIENNGWEAGARRYNQLQKMRDEQVW
ncbi:hypothetical protein ACVRY7_09545 [Streptococcus ictaluri]|uniref:Phage protein n=1 Tax=Streptococcus ictaluri 707-05 TaxID=764299 RepID=G5K0G0_9STRE|nr:hypothetical protein [Streptococcus ictaluri]EHI70645.1 hypothetical protein STRIC_0082 [Streptococcus ictaluri 707-05]